MVNEEAVYRAKVDAAAIAVVGVLMTAVFGYIGKHEAAGAANALNAVNATLASASVDTSRFEIERKKWADDESTRAPKYADRSVVCKGLAKLQGRFRSMGVGKEGFAGTLPILKQDFYAYRPEVELAHPSPDLLPLFDKVEALVHVDDVKSKTIAADYPGLYFKPIDAAMKLVLAECILWREQVAASTHDDAGAAAK